MVNTIKKVNNEVLKSNQNETSVQNSVVKYRENTLGYNALRNHVKQEYYHKVQGCSVKVQ
ncbi:hypothetical protein [Flavobacterium sp.]|uniref:hypothetical protein n=1 Tax=Flavobacterium sp. TaxID=239 RepID=UPI002D0AEA6D|nr:hypothetical protein [Flavobacterium sp.]HSD06342.1 hypothetical protein [Flavobacterium sp.]